MLCKFAVAGGIGACGLERGGYSLSIMNLPLILSCENATCAVPEAFRELFQGEEEVVTSARGWEPGALNLAQHFSREFRTPLLHGEITRLLVDLMRVPEHPEAWSEQALRLPEARREGLLKRHYTPYLATLRARIAEPLARHPAVLHLSVHTFPRDHEGCRSSADIRVRFDPGRDAEKQLAEAWRNGLRAAAPTLVVEQLTDTGASGDDLLTRLRAEHPAEVYLGLGLEVCQSFFLDGAPLRWDAVRKLLTSTLRGLIG